MDVKAASFGATSGPDDASGFKSLNSEEEFVQAIDIIGRYFPDSLEEIEVAVRAGVQPKVQDYTNRILVGCVDDDGAVQAVALCLEKKLPKNGLNIIEIVWFGSKSKGEGWGSRLFEHLVKESLKKKVDAILSTSTNAAIPFWLSRPNLRIADTVVRGGKRQALETPKEFGFKVAPNPTRGVMERLYADHVTRNRKGKMVGNFEGKPYRYCLSTSNHVWYILNKNLHMKCNIRKVK
mmetsp:Transcript_6150/g.9613  ORF Transcript_6150/g.9613 Transcript_6150/m.9613 type:complete len:236 (-) Transcript_6150:525-1232(-)|eukprot:CAMPEP_0203758078 /NCGR_PEP_ID=MMETSP0098-20131031/10840_1 /ASSEMBLY_ACC=CAM_ASM_000208 /TAXON_ID=96639 /ORGANISM=" , Strain NY0313808BC1" /LENGTH=235 /DNA_ID=CAMNT_0050650325 /DNA_START=271 /DNA_END=978 /DNA_ORIENTATION=-